MLSVTTQQYPPVTSRAATAARSSALCAVWSRPASGPEAPGTPRSKVTPHPARWRERAPPSVHAPSVQAVTSSWRYQALASGGSSAGGGGGMPIYSRVTWPHSQSERGSKCAATASSRRATAPSVPLSVSSAGRVHQRCRASSRSAPHLGQPAVGASPARCRRACGQVPPARTHRLRPLCLPRGSFPSYFRGAPETPLSATS